MQSQSNTVICTTAVPRRPEYLVGEAYHSGAGQGRRTWVGVPGGWGYQFTTTEVANHFTATPEFPKPCKLKCTSVVPDANFVVGEVYEATVLRTETALRIQVGPDDVSGDTTFNFTDIWQYFEIVK